MFIAGNIHENDLIVKCKSGDSGAFGVLMKNYRRRLYGYFLKTTNDESIAEDLMQDTLIKVWRGINKYEERTKFSSWLFTIAHNVCMDHLRKKKSYPGESLIDEDHGFTVDSDPHSELVRHENKLRLEELLRRLPEKQRRVILLRIYSDLTFKEISEITNESINTVLSHMYYAVRKLKKGMKEENAQ